MIRAHEGWINFTAAVALCTHEMVGWSRHSSIHADLALKALLTAVWRCKPTAALAIHSDQGSQHTGHERSPFIEEHSLVYPMSRRGNCRGNTGAERLLQRLKREQIKRRT